MFIQLFLDLTDVQYYGDIPKAPQDSPDKVETFYLCEDDYEYFDNDIDEIDFVCNALLDIGDVDYLTFEQCTILSNWIHERIKKPIEPRYKEILEVLCD